MPDNITFMSIPTDWRVPGQYIEIDNSRAVRGLPGVQHRILLLGQRLTAGSVAEGVLSRITRDQDGVDFFGRGSMLAQMIPAARKVNPTTEMWALALDDLVAGVKATGTIAITGTATEAATLDLYIAGTKVQVGIAVGDTATVVGDTIAAAVTAKPDLPVTAANVAGTVTFTAKHKGECGNAIDMRLGYYAGDKSAVAGLAFVLVAMGGVVAGAGNPDVTAAIAAMSTGAYYTIVSGWTDATNIAALEAELASRWGGLDMRAGHAFGWVPGSYSTLASYGSGRNSPHTTIVGLKNCPTLPWVNAAQFAAAVEFAGANDPARPFRGIALPNVMAPAEADRFTATERNLLLHDGISTVVFDQAGGCTVEQVITTYQTDSFGLDDVSLLKLNTKWTVDYMRYVFRVAVARDFPNHKLADDDVLPHIQPGQPIATPKLIRNTLIAAASQLESVGLLEGFEQFKTDLIVVRSAVDRDRVNAIIPPNVVNQFDVFAAAVQFIL